MFAVQKLDPRLARITATQVEWTWGWKGEAMKNSIDIPMVDCRELLPDPGYRRTFNPEDYINNSAFNPYDGIFRLPTEYLCPNTTKFILQGHYTTHAFQYVSIKLKGCDQDLLSEEEGECADQTAIDN